MQEKRSVGSFLNTILNGTALGIVAGLIANAVLSTLFKFLGGYFAPELFKTLASAMYLLQFSVPVLIGVAIGYTMKFKPLETAVLGAAILAGSGSLVFKPELKAWTAVPMGDLFNVIFVAIIATLIIGFIGDKLGSLTIIFLPILGGGIPAAIGLVTLPYAKQLTAFLAQLVLTFTTLQPLLMCILIAVAFSVFIVTPVSTVAMGIILFSNDNFIGAGAATLGVVSAAAVLAIGSMRAKNPTGVSIAIILGAIKLMMPNCARRPQLFVPMILTAALTGAVGYFLGIQGTHESAGFGIIGLIGPVKAFEMAQGGLLNIVICYFVLPFAAGFVIDKVLTMMKFYQVEAYATENLS